MTIVKEQIRDRAVVVELDGSTLLLGLGAVDSIARRMAAQTLFTAPSFAHALALGRQARVIPAVDLPSYGLPPWRPEKPWEGPEPRGGLTVLPRYDQREWPDLDAPPTRWAIRPQSNDIHLLREDRRAIQIWVGTIWSHDLDVWLARALIDTIERIETTPEPALHPVESSLTLDLTMFLAPGVHFDRPRERILGRETPEALVARRWAQLRPAVERYPEPGLSDLYTCADTLLVAGELLAGDVPWLADEFLRWSAAWYADLRLVDGGLARTGEEPDVLLRLAALRYLDSRPIDAKSAATNALDALKRCRARWQGAPEEEEPFDAMIARVNAFALPAIMERLDQQRY